MEQWPSAVADIVSNFESADFPDLTPEDRCTALLEILTVLPEEYSTSKLDKSQQRQVRAGIKAGAGCVLDLLLQLIRSNQPAIVERAIKALASWLDLDLPLDSVTEHVELCFAMIKTPKYFEVAVDAIMNALNSPTSHHTPTHGPFHPFCSVTRRTTRCGHSSSGSRNPSGAFKNYLRTGRQPLSTRFGEN